MNASFPHLFNNIQEKPVLSLCLKGPKVHRWAPPILMQVRQMKLSIMCMHIAKNNFTIFGPTKLDLGP